MAIDDEADAGLPPFPGDPRPEPGAGRPGDGAVADALRRGLGLLVRREQSRRELTRKLRQRGVDAADAATAVERLAGQGFQDDDRFAAAFARDRAAGGYGPLRIRNELAGHGLDGEQIEAALAACEADWQQRADAQIERRFRPVELADAGRRRKATDFLLRRGFAAGQAATAVRRRAQAATGDDDALPDATDDDDEGGPGC